MTFMLPHMAKTEVFSRMLRRTIAGILLGFSTIAAHGQPNVVLIIGDDQGWRDFGFMGHPTIQTPHLDNLAEGGLLFPRGYVVSSLCRPSLATIATGLYPHEHGITGNDPIARNNRDAYLELNREWIEHYQMSPQIAGLLGSAGYVSHQSGKWWEGHCRCGEFTEGMTHGDPERSGRHGDEGLRIGRVTMKPIFDFIDEAGDRPFFIWYAPFLPHLPHNPPERLLEKYRAPERPPEMAKYYAMCEWLDETVGRLIGHLEKRKLRENTLIMFLSDNGWVQPLEGEPGSGTAFGAPRGKRSPYDGGLRTPIIVNWPGHVNPDRVDVPVSSVDIAPTIAAAAGIVPDARWRGVNLMNREAVRSRDAVFGAIFTHNAAELFDPRTSLQYRWVVSGNWKLIEPYSALLPDAPTELYDVVSDPNEEHERSKEHADKVAELRRLLTGWWDVGTAHEER